MKLAYLAYTFHLFGDCLQFSLLVEKNEGILQKYVNEVINNIPGILRTTVCEIVKTHSFISHEDWKKYASQHPELREWGEDILAQLEHFRL